MSLTYYNVITSNKVLIASYIFCISFLITEFSNGQKCELNQYQQSCEIHQSCGECLSAYPNLNNQDSPNPCIWCTGQFHSHILPVNSVCLKKHFFAFFTLFQAVLVVDVFPEAPIVSHSAQTIVRTTTRMGLFTSKKTINVRK